MLRTAKASSSKRSAQQISQPSKRRISTAKRAPKVKKVITNAIHTTTKRNASNKVFLSAKDAVLASGLRDGDTLLAGGFGLSGMLFYIHIPSSEALWSSDEPKKHHQLCALHPFSVFQPWPSFQQSNPNRLPPFLHSQSLHLSIPILRYPHDHHSCNS